MELHLRTTKVNDSSLSLPPPGISSMSPPLREDVTSSLTFETTAKAGKTTATTTLTTSMNSDSHSRLQHHHHHDATPMWTLPNSSSRSSLCCDNDIGIMLFLIGVWNNAPYVIMLASAKDVAEGGVALVYIANIVPGTCVCTCVCVCFALRARSDMFWYQVMGLLLFCQ